MFARARLMTSSGAVLAACKSQAVHVPEAASLHAAQLAAPSAEPNHLMSLWWGQIALVGGVIFHSIDFSPTRSLAHSQRPARPFFGTNFTLRRVVCSFVCLFVSSPKHRNTKRAPVGHLDHGRRLPARPPVCSSLSASSRKSFISNNLTREPHARGCSQSKSVRSVGGTRKSCIRPNPVRLLLHYKEHF